MKHIKIYLLVLVLSISWLSLAAAQEASSDPAHLFYKANSLYERREFENALQEYKKIADDGVESGQLYYNMGNTYFKLGKIGDAILYYRKAERLIPADSDLKSNLAYVRSLTEDSGLQPQAQNKFVWLVGIPFKELTLNGVAKILITLFLTVIILIIGGIVSPVFKRRATFIFYPLLILLILTITGFAVRYYSEEVLTHGICVAKEAECKYEPIEKSTTYFTLKEGQEVLVLMTRNGWRRIKRLDGKLAWVKNDAVEEI